MMFEGASPPGSHRPRLAVARPILYSFPSSPVSHMIAPVGTLSVQVAPRAGRTEVRLEGERVLVRVKAPPIEGRATDEARRALAAALGIPPSGVRLRSGARARHKLFELDGISSEEALRRLGRR
jgi:uncharacterized protein